MLWEHHYYLLLGWGSHRLSASGEEGGAQITGPFVGGSYFFCRLRTLSLTHSLAHSLTHRPHVKSVSVFDVSDCRGRSCCIDPRRPGRPCMLASGDRRWALFCCCCCCCLPPGDGRAGVHDILSSVESVRRVPSTNNQGSCRTPIADDRRFEALR